MTSTVRSVLGVSITPDNMAERLGFLCRNLWCARRLRPFPEATFDTYRVGPLARTQLATADRLYGSLTDGNLGSSRRALLRLLGSRLMVVAHNACTGEMVGLICFYFNARDRRDNTIHIGYYGLSTAVRSKGLGTFMTTHALRHLACAGLTGVSSRVSCTNVPSMKVMFRLGFTTRETYFDRSLWEERHYLICDLDRYAADSAGGTEKADKPGRANR